jgi:hypothetical protein
MRFVLDDPDPVDTVDILQSFGSEGTLELGSCME